MIHGIELCSLTQGADEIIDVDRGLGFSEVVSHYQNIIMDDDVTYVGVRTKVPNA